MRDRKDIKEVAFNRILNAPRELVFMVWTEPDRLRQWWGPAGFTNPVCEVDLRPGGSILIHMRGPDGTVYPMTGIFKEIAPPGRLAFTSSALDDQGMPLFEVLTTAIFTEDGKKTLLSLSQCVIHATAGATRHLAGMELGWTQGLDRLSEHIANGKGPA